MFTRSATVLFKDSVAGTLAEIPAGGTRFTYEPSWTTSIACSLGVEEREHVWRAGLHPFFQHLGPEGWLRERQARAGRVDQDDDFGLLLRYGRDCIGAVGVEPAEALETDPSDAAADIEANAIAGSRRTVSGVQRKLLAYRDEGRFHAATDRTPATYIAKFNPHGSDTLVRNEALTLRLAGELLGKGEVTKFETGTVVGFDEPALIVERFDRTPDGAKLRLEDFAQILAQPRGFDFKGKYEATYEEVASAIRTHSARAGIDVARYYRRVVVCFIVGNADAHLKNFALLERPEGLRLAPAYDLLNTLYYGAQYDTHVALGLNGEHPLIDALTRPEIERFGHTIGLSDRTISLILTQLRTRLRRSQVVNRSTNAPSEFLDSYVEIVRNIASRLLEP